MKIAAPLLLALSLLLGCSRGESDTPTGPGRGSLDLAVNPNPVRATRVTGENDTYDFPLELVVRETGGESVTITGITIRVRALGINVLTRDYDANYLRDRGYSPNIAAGSTARYSLTPRASAPDAAFSSAVSADIQVEGVDGKGNTVRQTENVSVRR